jgi:hypothetical protein
LHPRQQGTLAQMVEQRTENPCVPGSIPGGTTKTRIAIFGFFCFYTLIAIKKPLTRRGFIYHV